MDYDDRSSMGVGLYLMGEPIDPVFLNTLLNVEQKVYIAKGDPRIHLKTGKFLGIHGWSTWGFVSTQAISSDEIDDHTDWLCSKVSNAVDILRTTSSRKAFLEVDFSLTAPFLSGSFVFSENFLELAKQLDARIGVGMRYQPTTHRPIANTAG